VGLLLGAIIAGYCQQFISYSHLTSLFKPQIQHEEKLNDELKKGYVPPREGKR